MSRTETARRDALERGELFTVGVSLEEVDGAATVLAVSQGSPPTRAAVALATGPSR